MSEAYASTVLVIKVIMSVVEDFKPLVRNSVSWGDRIAASFMGSVQLGNHSYHSYTVPGIGIISREPIDSFIIYFIIVVQKPQSRA